MNKRDLIAWANHSPIYREEYFGDLPHDIWYIIKDAEQVRVSAKLCQKLLNQNKLKPHSVPTKISKLKFVTGHSPFGGSQ